MTPLVCCNREDSRGLVEFSTLLSFSKIHDIEVHIPESPQLYHRLQTLRGNPQSVLGFRNSNEASPILCFLPHDYDTLILPQHNHLNLGPRFHSHPPNTLSWLLAHVLWGVGGDGIQSFAQAVQTCDSESKTHRFLQPHPEGRGERDLMY